jgi:EAL domain-containing protein (putative c-di-GMP-specific phosphodiesterase class I)
VPLGQWVLREALRQLMQWRVASLPLRRVAVNVSVPQLRDEGFAKSVVAAVREFGMVPSFLDLEITESVFAGQSGPVRETVEKLHASGLRLALDDFGAGYSSLGYLSRFPVQKLKVDKVFIDDVGSGRVGEAVTRATIELGRALDVAVLAEGVEYDAQLTWLREHAVDEVQGDLIGPPVPPDEFVERFGYLVS